MSIALDLLEERHGRLLDHVIWLNTRLDGELSYTDNILGLYDEELITEGEAARRLNIDARELFDRLLAYRSPRSED